MPTKKAIYSESDPDMLPLMMAWGKFYDELRAKTNEELKEMWERIIHITLVNDYVPLISVFDAAKAIFDEMDYRGIAPDTHLFVSKRKLNNG